MAANSQLDLSTNEYPRTKMNFLISVAGTVGKAAFSEVTGIDASVEVIEFRQGNSGSLAKVKIPGLVKHNNVTLKMGFIAGTEIMEWARQCLAETKRSSQFLRKDVTIELIDPMAEDLSGKVTTATQSQQWVLKNAFVATYKGADLDAKSSDVAIESIELAYEELVFPGQTT